MSPRRRLFRTRRARQDLIDIWDHIAADNAKAADAVLDRIDKSCLGLLDHPHLGPARDDIRPGLRYLIVGDYVILYRVLDDGVEIVRVVHGRRDLFNLF
jgi:toxin ParE1/3/4